MKTICLILFVAPVFAIAETAMNSKEISGTVRIIRSNPETEVFFKDLKDSVIIPFGSKHNQLFEACEESRKKNIPVKLVIDPQNHRVIGVADPQKKNVILGQAPSASDLKPSSEPKLTPPTPASGSSK